RLKLGVAANRGSLSRARSNALARSLLQRRRRIVREIGNGVCHSQWNCHPERSRRTPRSYTSLTAPQGIFTAVQGRSTSRFFASLRMTRCKLKMLDGTAEAVPFPVLLRADG